jgi:APA family basic amino acid/polyamine antiporter
VIFFAYIGFDAVSTCAQDAKNPQRDMPIGILGSLAICTVLYILVSFAMTGIVPYHELNVPDPIAVAVSAIGLPVVAVVIKVGALTGLGSVLLVNTYGQSRILYSMAADGLLPPAFARIHPRFSTPANGTILVAAISAIAAALLPISLLADLVSLGTAAVFTTVAICVMWLRSARPDLSRPFSVPLGGVWIGRAWIGVVPVLAILFCLTMMGPVLADIVGKAIHGEWIPAAILFSYIAIGGLIYWRYGRRHSRLRFAMA